MAELLIYNKDHWMDALTPLEVDAMDKQHKGFKAKYSRRTQRGDIIEVREDGSPITDKELQNFLVIQVPGIKKKDVSYLAEPLGDFSDPYKPIITKKYKYKLDKDLLSTDMKTKFEKNTNMTMTETQFMSAKVQKSG